MTQRDTELLHQLLGDFNDTLLLEAQLGSVEVETAVDKDRHFVLTALQSFDEEQLLICVADATGHDDAGAGLAVGFMVLERVVDIATMVSVLEALDAGILLVVAVCNANSLGAVQEVGDCLHDVSLVKLGLIKSS